MAAVIGEELLGAEAGVSGAEAGGYFGTYPAGYGGYTAEELQEADLATEDYPDGYGGYSRQELDEADKAELDLGNNGLIGFERFGDAPGYLSNYRGKGLPDLPSKKEVSSSAFKMDEAPQGFFRSLFSGKNMNRLFYADYAASKVGQGIGGVVTAIGNIYKMYRSNKKLHKADVENTVDRHRAGIVFRGQENRDQLVRGNQIPAYYSTSNIKKLLRQGLMPFGWNREMAVEQGFGQKIYAQEMKKVTTERSKDFLARQQQKKAVRDSLGDLQNLRDKFKTRKLLAYYNQS